MLRSLSLLCACFLFLGAILVHAEADGPDFFRVTGIEANDVLNVRVDASANSPKIGEIPYDAEGIRNLGCKGGLSYSQWADATAAEREAAESLRWCKIEYQGVTGWAAGRFLAEGMNAGRSIQIEESSNYWRLVLIGDRPVAGDADLSFTPEGAVFGSTGCNRFQGKARTVGSSLEFLGPMALTMMACATEELSIQEQMVLSVMVGSATVIFDALTDQIRIVNSNVESELVYQRVR